MGTGCHQVKGWTENAPTERRPTAGDAFEAFKKKSCPKERTSEKKNVASFHFLTSRVVLSPVNAVWYVWSSVLQ